MLSRKIVVASFFVLALWVVACDVHAKEPNILVGSIPGDSAAKQMLAINTSEGVDFIRLRIALNEGDRRFDLTATYGIGKPNTRGFENGGKSMSAKGRLEMIEKDRNLIYRLSDAEAGVDISLFRLNDQMFHVLSQNGRLLAGNGGWNYTLSIEGDKKLKSGTLPNQRKIDLSKDPEPMVFAGRTPCIEIARELNIPVSDDCFKLKWKLTLNGNPQSKQPAAFTLQRTFRRPEPLEGKWRIVEDISSVIYKLDANDGSTMSFLRLDDSLLFLDNAGRLLKGNGEFGYTLDRQRNEIPLDSQKAKME